MSPLMGNVYTLHSRPVAVTVPGSRNRDESVDVSLLDKALSMDASVGVPSLLRSETESVSAEIAVLLSGVLARVAEIVDFAEQGVIAKAAPLHGQHASRVLKREQMKRYRSRFMVSVLSRQIVASL